MHDLHTLLTDMAAREEFSGVALIKSGDSDLFFGSYGMANRAYDVPNARNTVFATASVTKMFTAVATLQLIEQNRTSLITPVVEILDLANSSISRDISLHHLLSHTSGMGDYFGDDEQSMIQLWEKLPNYSMKSLEQFLPLFSDKPKLFSVGDDFGYCNAGYILLGLVVEKLSKMSYFDYVRQHIFAPAGMSDTDFYSFAEAKANVAEGYIPTTDSAGKILGWQRNIYSVPAYGASDGGAFATADDLIKFMRALRSGILIPQELFRSMVSSQVRVSDRFAYGYGMWLLLDGQGKIIRYGHTGEDPGVSARVAYYPQQDIDVVILANQSGCTNEVLRQINISILS